MKTYLNLTTNNDQSRIELTEFVWDGSLMKRLLIQQQTPNGHSAAAINHLDERMAKLIVAGLVLAFPNIQKD